MRDTWWRKEANFICYAEQCGDEKWVKRQGRRQLTRCLELISLPPTTNDQNDAHNGRSISLAIIDTTLPTNSNIGIPLWLTRQWATLQSSGDHPFSRKWTCPDCAPSGLVTQWWTDYTNLEKKICSINNINNKKSTNIAHKLSIGALY